MEIVGFEAAPGAQFNSKQVDEIGRFIVDIFEELGMVTPEILLARARGSPIEHLIYKWNEAEAARLWRLVQCTHILTHIIVIHKVGDQLVRSRYFHQVTIDTVTERQQDQLVKLKIYKPITNILLNQEEKQEVLDDILKRFIDLWEKYAMYKELDPIFAAINKVAKTLK